MKKVLLVILVCLLPASMVMAAGFSIGEFGGRSATMGNAVVAQAYDASTLFYNPAGLGFLDGTQLYGNVSVIFSSAKFVGASPMFPDTVYKAKEQVFPPIGIYATHRFTEKFAVGLSLTTPFGLGLAWEDDFPGRFISRDVTLETFYLTPVVAYTISPNLSVSAGLDVVLSSVNLQRNILLFNSQPGTGTEVGEVEMDGSGKTAYGFTAGVMYKGEKLGLGAMYRHKVSLKIEDASAKFKVYDNITPAGVGAVAKGLFVDQNGGTEINIPNYFAVGIYYKLLENLGAEIAYAWYGWSVFDKLDLSFDNPQLNQSIAEDYKNEYQLRFGAHYDVSPSFQIRAGYIYDRTPQPIQSVSPLLPDDTRSDFTFGFGYTTGKFKVDAGYMFVDIGRRSTIENGEGMNDNGFNGEYNSRADILMLSLGYSIR
jgi:long-chain fatty acid transport protein